MKKTSISILFSLLAHLSSKRRKQMTGLLMLMTLSALSELFSLGAILPFLTILSDPNAINDNKLISELAVFTGINNSIQLFYLTTIVFISTALITAIIRLLNVWCNSRFAAAIGSDLSCLAYSKTLCQPYPVHVKRNTGDTITGISYEVSITVNSLNSFLQSLTSLFVALSLFLGLVAINWKVSIISLIIFGVLYGFLGYQNRKKLRKNSKIINHTKQRLMRTLQEGLASIRDILLDSNQDTYVKIYKELDISHRISVARNQFYTVYPRYIVETAGIIFMAVLGFSLSSLKYNEGEIIPLLGAIALCSQRILPALQQIYGGWSQLQGTHSSMSQVVDMLNQPYQPLSKVKAEAITTGISIELERINFSYSKKSPLIIKELDLYIESGKTIGIIGRSGNGKSTLIDLIMGLLEPNSGNIRINGSPLYFPSDLELLGQFRSSIGHVPQTIYLKDGSIAENIAFGIPKHLIDLNRLEMAIQRSQLENFVKNSKNGYETFVGERGIKLSGGQRQRIGIARAFYKDFHVLILDEATSALDVETESMVINSMLSISNPITIIMITHRKSTLRNCHYIYEIDDAGSLTRKNKSEYFL